MSKEEKIKKYWELRQQYSDRDLDVLFKKLTGKYMEIEQRQNEYVEAPDIDKAINALTEINELEEEIKILREVILDLP